MPLPRGRVSERESAERSAAPVLPSRKEPLTVQPATGEFMRIRFAILLAVIFVVLPASMQAAQMTLSDLRDICGGTDELSTAACNFYILGVTEGAGLGAGVAKDKGHFCIPEGVSSKQMVLIVKKAMTADLAAFPEDKNMPAVSFVAASMQQAFPCGK